MAPQTPYGHMESDRVEFHVTIGSLGPIPRGMERPQSDSTWNRTAIGPRSDLGLTSVGPQSDLGGTAVGARSDLGRTSVALQSGVSRT